MSAPTRNIGVHLVWERPWTILVVALVLRLAMLPLIEGELHDGVSRVLLARDWLAKPYLLTGTTTWPDLNYLAPAGLIAVTGELYWTTRLGFLFIALTNIPALQLLVSGTLGRRAATIAAWILALNPFHMLLSVSGALSEPAFISAALLALWCVLRFRDDPRCGWVVGAGILVGLATGFRFDGAIWGAILGLVLLIPLGGAVDRVPIRLRVRAFSLLAVLCAIYPVLLLLRWNALYIAAGLTR